MVKREEHCKFQCNVAFQKSVSLQTFFTAKKGFTASFLDCPFLFVFLPKASPSISAESLSVYFCREPLLSFLPKACPSKSGTLNPRPHSQAVVTISRSLTNGFNPRGP